MAAWGWEELDATSKEFSLSCKYSLMQYFNGKRPPPPLNSFKNQKGTQSLKNKITEWYKIKNIFRCSHPFLLVRINPFEPFCAPLPQRYINFVFPNTMVMALCFTFSQTLSIKTQFLLQNGMIFPVSQAYILPIFHLMDPFVHFLVQLHPNLTQGRITTLLWSYHHYSMQNAVINILTALFSLA